MVPRANQRRPRKRRPISPISTSTRSSFEAPTLQPEFQALTEHSFVRIRNTIRQPFGRHRNARQREQPCANQRWSLRAIHTAAQHAKGAKYTHAVSATIDMQLNIAILSRACSLRAGNTTTRARSGIALLSTQVHTKIQRQRRLPFFSLVLGKTIFVGQGRTRGLGMSGRFNGWEGFKAWGTSLC